MVVFSWGGGGQNVFVEPKTFGNIIIIGCGCSDRCRHFYTEFLQVTCGDPVVTFLEPVVCEFHSYLVHLLIIFKHKINKWGSG